MEVLPEPSPIERARGQLAFRSGVLVVDGFDGLCGTDRIIKAAKRGHQVSDQTPSAVTSVA